MTEKTIYVRAPNASSLALFESVAESLGIQQGQFLTLDEFDRAAIAQLEYSLAYCELQLAVQDINQAATVEP